MAVIPGTTNSASFDKVDVIHHHIQSAIQMIAIGCHPFSTHTVVMACKELIMNVAKSRDIFIEWDPKVYIKPEHHKQYLTIERHAYNYFKHADRDAEHEYNGPSLENLRYINNIQTIFNIHGYSKLATESNSGFNAFVYLMMIRHPEHFNLDFLDAHSSMKEQFQRLDRTPATMLLALRLQLFEAGRLPKIPPA